MKLSMIVLLFFIFYSCNNKETVTLYSNQNTNNKIKITYVTDKIEFEKIIVENGKEYKDYNNLYYLKDGYYEDVDVVMNDSIKDYKKVLSLENITYTYKTQFSPFENTVYVSIKKIPNKLYQYHYFNENIDYKIIYSKNYRILRIEERKSDKNKIIIYK